MENQLNDHPYPEDRQFREKNNSGDFPLSRSAHPSYNSNLDNLRRGQSYPESSSDNRNYLNSELNGDHYRGGFNPNSRYESYGRRRSSIGPLEGPGDPGFEHYSAHGPHLHITHEDRLHQGDRGSFSVGAEEIRENRGHRGKGPKNWKRSDDKIMDEVCDRLEDSDQIDASEIDVDVKDRVVILKGKVDSRRTKRFTENLIENCRGVEDINNRLTINKDKESAA